MTRTLVASTAIRKKYVGSARERVLQGTRASRLTGLLVKAVLYGFITHALIAKTYMRRTTGFALSATVSNSYSKDSYP